MRRVAKVPGVLGLRVLVRERAARVRIPERARGRQWVVVVRRRDPELVPRLPRPIVAPERQLPVEPRLRLRLLRRAHGRRDLALDSELPLRRRRGHRQGRAVARDVLI